MEKEKILSCVDHTLLKQDAVWEQIRELCDDAVSFRTASVCIPPSFVADARRYLDSLDGQNGKPAVCTVIGFPNGYSTAAVKAFEAEDALKNGADEIDMVINIGDLKEKKYGKIEDEIRQIKEICGGKILKVIIETCLLDEEEKISMCRIVTRAGADYIKTSTGFSSGGATFEDVALFAAHVGPGVKIKAAGGISSLKDAEEFIRLGASRLGTSRIVKILKEGNA